MGLGSCIARRLGEEVITNWPLNCGRTHTIGLEGDAELEEGKDESFEYMTPESSIDIILYLLDKGEDRA